MRRIILILGVIVVIGAWAAPAVAGCFNERPVVCAPANGDNGRSGDHAPDPTIKAVLPENDGTNNASDHSPSIIQSSGDRGDPCTPS